MNLRDVPVFFGMVQGGRLNLDDPGMFMRLVGTLEGQRVKVMLSKHRPRRSLKANAYYWGVVIPTLADHLGYDTDEMHEALKIKLLATHTDDPLPTVRSSASLDTKEFAEYIDNCIRLAAELGCEISEPIVE